MTEHATTMLKFLRNHLSRFGSTRAPRFDGQTNIAPALHAIASIGGGDRSLQVRSIVTNPIRAFCNSPPCRSRGSHPASAGARCLGGTRQVTFMASPRNMASRKITGRTSVFSNRPTTRNTANSVAAVKPNRLSRVLLQDRVAAVNRGRNQRQQQYAEDEAALGKRVQKDVVGVVKGQVGDTKLVALHVQGVERLTVERMRADPANRVPSE